MKTIDTLIFDFGDVFINLDKFGSVERAMKRFDLPDFDDGMKRFNRLYETGKIETETFVNYYLGRFPVLSREEMIFLWNDIIRDFPLHRLHFIKELALKGNYRLILLSNTNELHIDYIKTRVPFYDEFKSQFNRFYLSHQIGLRKPESNIYEFVLEQDGLKPQQCFFIDDTEENTASADKMGFHTWNINPEREDVTELFTKL